MSAAGARALRDARTPDELERVREALARARASPFYSRKLGGRPLRDWDDFFSLPTTTKQELRAASPMDTLAVPLSEAWHYHESFGTTGRPIGTWFTAADFDREVELTARWTQPIAPGMRVLNRIPYAFAVPPFVIEARTRRDGGIVVPASNLTWNVPYDRALELIRRLAVEVLVTFSLEPVILELAAPLCGLDMKRDLASVKHLLLGGSLVTEPLRRHLEAHWGAKVGLVYGLTETGGIGAMCDAWRVHVSPDAHVLEIVDPATGAPVAEGEVGLLLVTSHYRQASPLVRYESQDYARWIPGPCPCGAPGPTLEILGRVDDTIAFDGQRIFHAQLQSAVLELARPFDSAVYFVIVTERGVRVRLESHNGRRDLDRLAVEKLHDALRVPVTVDVCAPGEILDVKSMVRAPTVGKPQVMSDWRRDDRRCFTQSEALLTWPRVGFRDLVGMVWQFFKNAVLRRLVR